MPKTLTRHLTYSVSKSNSQTLTPKPATPIILSMSVGDSLIPPVIHVKNLGVILDFSLSLRTYIQSSSRSSWLYLQNVSTIWSYLPIFTTEPPPWTKLPSTPHQCFNSCTTSTWVPLQNLLTIAAWVVLLNPSCFTQSKIHTFWNVTWSRLFHNLLAFIFYHLSSLLLHSSHWPADPWTHQIQPPLRPA